MRRWLPIVALLLFPTAAFANPVAPQEAPPDASVLSSLLLEVAVVTGILWKCRLRLSVFVPSWYVINFISFYVLLPGFQNLNYVLHLYDKVPVVVTIIAMELFVVIVEAVVLYAVIRSPVLLKQDSRLVTWRLAFLASFAGNVASAFIYPLIHGLISRLI